jgi:hypothetical protein
MQPIFYVLLFGVMSCMWPDVVSLWIRQRNSIKFCANLGKIEMETPAVIRQAFGEESLSRTWKVQNSPKPKKGEKGEVQSQEHAHHFLWHRGDYSQRIRPGRPNSQFCILL